MPSRLEWGLTVLVQQGLRTPTRPFSENCFVIGIRGSGCRWRSTVGDVGLRARELLREISRSHEMSIHAGAINRDHVHMLLSIPPHLSVSRAVQYLKGKSSHKLLSEYQSLRKRYWGQHLWSRGYWAATSGNVTDEIWKKYIEDQKPEEPDDNFKVV